MPNTSRLVLLAPVVDEAMARKPRFVIKNTVVIDSDPGVPLASLAKSTGVTGDVLVFHQNLLMRLDRLPFVGPVRVRSIPRDMSLYEFMNQRTVLPYRMAGTRMTLDLIRLHPEYVRDRRVVCLNSGVLPKSKDYPGIIFFEPLGSGFHTRISFDREPLKKDDIVIIVSDR